MSPRERYPAPYRLDVDSTLPKHGGNTMKTMSAVLAFALLLFADLVLAQSSAVATSVTGSVQVQTGTATPRALRLGDEVRQGDTVSTGANSNVVLKFADGHGAALTSNSRMTINAYPSN